MGVQSITVMIIMILMLTVLCADELCQQLCQHQHGIVHPCKHWWDQAERTIIHVCPQEHTHKLM